jgi:hypothetical protein
VSSTDFRHPTFLHAGCQRKRALVRIQAERKKSCWKTFIYLSFASKIFAQKILFCPENFILSRKFYFAQKILFCPEKFILPRTFYFAEKILFCPENFILPQILPILLFLPNIFCTEKN